MADNSLCRISSQISNLPCCILPTCAGLRSQISNLAPLPCFGPPRSVLHSSSVGSPALPQTPPQPYAVIPRDAVNYSGPDRDASHDLRGIEIKIGLLAPLTGPRQNEGKALLQAAQLAIEDEAARPFPGGRRLSLVARDQSDSWGRATNEIVRLVFDDQVAALVTSLDGDSAHLAEQVGNKVGIPIVTISTDPSTTQINLPWIFRLAPTDTQQAGAFARDIYTERKLQKVVLITDSDHDGRVGGEEFQKAAHALSAPPFIQLEMNPAGLGLDSTAGQAVAAKPEALVFWTDPKTAAKLLPQFLDQLPSTQVYLCQEAAQARFGPDQKNVWIVASKSAATSSRAKLRKSLPRADGRTPRPGRRSSLRRREGSRYLAAALRPQSRPLARRAGRAFGLPRRLGRRRLRSRRQRRERLHSCPVPFGRIQQPEVAPTFRSADADLKVSPTMKPAHRQAQHVTS